MSDAAKVAAWLYANACPTDQQQMPVRFGAKCVTMIWL